MYVVSTYLFAKRVSITHSTSFWISQSSSWGSEATSFWLHVVSIMFSHISSVTRNNCSWHSSWLMVEHSLSVTVTHSSSSTVWHCSSLLTCTSFSQTLSSKKLFEKYFYISSEKLFLKNFFEKRLRYWKLCSLLTGVQNEKFTLTFEKQLTEYLCNK